MQGSTRFVVLIIVGICLVSVTGQAVEYSHDAKAGDLVRVTLEDGSTFRGTLAERTESRLILTVENERIVLLRSAVDEIVVLPSQGEQVRLTMIDDTENTGQWAGQDDQNIYLQGEDGRLAFLKSQVQRIEPVRRSEEQSSEDAQTLAQGTQTDSTETSLGIFAINPYGITVVSANPKNRLPTMGIGALYESSTWRENRVLHHLEAWTGYVLTGTDWIQGLVGLGSIKVVKSSRSQSLSYLPFYLGVQFKIPITDTFGIQVVAMADVAIPDKSFSYVIPTIYRQW